MLTTERLALRPVAVSDHPALLAHWAIPDVRHFLSDGVVLSPAQTTKAIEGSTRRFATASYGLRLIRQTSGTELIRMVSLRPLEDLQLEIFYSLAPGQAQREEGPQTVRTAADPAEIGYPTQCLGQG